MEKYFFVLAYKGTTFNGWQNQKDGKSVQEAVENALAAVLKKITTVHGCGRTDAGVHAENYVLHVLLPEVEQTHFLFKLNNKLPAQIAIKQMLPVIKDANAQLDAISRTYTYYVHTEKDPYLNNFSTFYPLENLDFMAMEKACALIPTVRDFRNFCIEPDKHKSTHCTLRSVKMHLHPDKKRIAFRFEGDHYLRSMIRMLVGELLEVGKGKTSLADFKGYLNLSLKKPKHHKAFAQGLHLSAIQYPYFKTEVPPIF